MNQPPFAGGPTQHASLPPSAHNRRWWVGLALVLGGLLTALLFTPGLSVEQKMIAVMQGVCAQQNNLFVAGLQLPICARCVGIYSTGLVSLVWLLASGRGRAGRVPPWSISGVLVAFVLIMAFDGFNSFFQDTGLPYLYPPRNDLRTLTGLGMGVTIAVALLLICNLALRADVDTRLPVLKNWFELVGLLLVNFLLLAAVFGNLEFMYWPMALLALLGMLGVIFLLCTLVCALFMGYDNRVTQLDQLARPALVAIIPTAVLVGGLALVRHWLELQGLVL